MTDRMDRRQALRVTAAAGLSLATGGLSVGALIRSGRLRKVEGLRIRMGTPVSIAAIHPDARGAREMVDSAFAEMERLEGILSRHRSETPLSRLNRTGRLEKAPAELLHVLGWALEYAERSQGAFDPSVAPLLELHRESFARTGGAPDATEVRRILARVDYRSVNVVGPSVRLLRPGMALTLDGIAKGYIVDRTREILESAGAEAVLVDGGGDLASHGTPRPGLPWEVGIRDPERRDGVLHVARLRNGGLATSGDYVQSFTPDRRHHHIVDPRTGRSPEGLSSVSVVTGSALHADALSTATFTLGPEEGLRFLERTPGAEGLLVTKEGERLRTRGFPGDPV